MGAGFKASGRRHRYSAVDDAFVPWLRRLVVVGSIARKDKLKQRRLVIYWISQLRSGDVQSVSINNQICPESSAYCLRGNVEGFNSWRNAKWPCVVDNKQECRRIR